MLLFYGYKKCGTSRKAEKFLNTHQIAYEFIDITQNPPDQAQLERLIAQSGQPVRKFFNTSGQVYRQLGLKDKLKDMQEGEMISLLARNGKLIKRPLVSNGTISSVGFREAEFEQKWI